MPLGPPVTCLPVEQHEADDLAEGQRHDREIVAFQAQHRKAEQHPPERCEQTGDWQQHPKRPRAELIEIDAHIGIGRREQRKRQAVLREQREGISADGVERDIAEIEQPGETDHDVQPPSEHHIGQHQNAEIENVTLVVEQHRHEEREDQKSGCHKTPKRCDPGAG